MKEEDLPALAGELSAVLSFMEQLNEVDVTGIEPMTSVTPMRLKRRAEDADDVIERRLQNARLEMEHWRDYDYVVVNEDLDRAFAEVKAIVIAERLRRDRRPGLFDFVSNLLDERTA